MAAQYLNNPIMDVWATSIEPYILVLLDPLAP